MKNSSIRNGAIGIATVALLLAGPVAAQAAPGPDPNSGPVAGGTVVTVPAPEGVTLTELHAGGLHTLATGSDGNTYAWGHNAEGQLGTGDTTTVFLPVPIVQPDGVTFSEIDAGAYHTVALGSDGNAYTWGLNSSGEIGNGTTANVSVPTPVALPGGVSVTQIEAGEYSSMVVGSDGVIYAWGKNNAGQIGTGSQGGIVTSPVAVSAPGGAKFTQVSIGSHHTLALADDGNAYGWGSGSGGILGNGGTSTQLTPTPVTLPEGVTFTQIETGGMHSLAIGDDGTTYVWGTNYMGQLGNGGSASDVALVPQPVSVPAGVVFETVETGGLSAESDDDGTSAGGYHTLAISTEGVTYAWGGNQNGQIGNGTVNEIAWLPVEVHVPAGVKFTSVGTGIFHSTAVGDDGKAYTWGYNALGQLGNGTDVDEHEPIEVVAAPTVTEVSFGGEAGTDLNPGESGAWEVATPEHAAGPVDVVVSWEQFGAVQTPVTYPGGFTYRGDPPMVSDPADVTVKDGGSASFTVEATGAPVPQVSWEVSTDGGKTWGAADAEWSVVVDGASSTLSFTAAVAQSGMLVRAVADDGVNDPVESGVAELTVTKLPIEGGEGEGGGNGGTGNGSGNGAGSGSGSGKLPATGDVGPRTAALAGTLLLVLGAGAAVAGVARARREHA